MYFCLSDFCYIYGLLYFSSSIFDACDCWPMLLLVLSLFCLIVNSRTLNLHIFAVLVFLFFFFIVFLNSPVKTWLLHGLFAYLIGMLLFIYYSGWHLCSICEKNAYYMCYTCTFSLCKGCTKDAVILCVRGNKGFCETCMKTVMLIERNEQGNKEMVRMLSPLQKKKKKRRCYCFFCGPSHMKIL